jgi:hypothetical protein
MGFMLGRKLMPFDGLSPQKHDKNPAFSISIRHGMHGACDANPIGPPQPIPE